MTKQEVKEQLTISDCLNHYGTIKSRYNDLYFCPFHSDKKPSLVAKNRRGVATCLSQQCVSGADIFTLIMKFEGCNFSNAVRKATALVGREIAPVYSDEKISYSSKNSKKDPSIIPDTFSLEDRHIQFLRKRFGKHWMWVAQKFNISAWLYHIVVPVTNDLMVFIPLNKETPSNPKGDRVFYRGKNRSPQVFPYFEEYKNARNILMVEGEKDVMRSSLALHLEDIDDWAVITNTMGANNLKEDTSMFSAFDKDKIDKVTICYDHDDVGRNANQTAYKNAKTYFSNKTKINIIQFPNNYSKGYDVSDYLNEGNLIKSIIKY